MSQEVGINGDRINGISYNLLKNVAYFGYNPFTNLLLSKKFEMDVEDNHK